MHKFHTLLLGVLLLLSPALSVAAQVQSAEPTDSILRPGRDLEWSQPEDTPYPFAAEQKVYQQWMRTVYKAWKSSLTEPMDPETFAEENRRVRQVLTAYHRRAVRTGDWDVLPSIAAGTDRIAAVRPVERKIERMSRRHIIREAERMNAVRVK